MNSNVIDASLRLLALWALAATVAIVMIALLRPMVRKAAGARAALWLWWLLPLALVVTAVPKDIRIHVALPESSMVLLDAGVPADNPSVQVIDEASKIDRAEMSSSAAVAFRANLPRLLLLGWFMGAMLLIAQMMWAQLRYQRSIRWQANGRGVLPEKAVPAVVGLWSPRVVLPADFAQRYSPAEQRLIRLHEAVHQLRRDGIANLCMSALRAVLWFHPLMHWAARALGDDQESACDEAVIARHPRQIRTYAEALLRSGAAAAASPLPMVCHWQAYHPTVKRIAMLKQYRRERGGRNFARLAFMAGAALSAGLVYALQPAEDVWVHAPKLGKLSAASEAQAPSMVQPGAPELPVTQLEPDSSDAKSSRVRVALAPVSAPEQSLLSMARATGRQFYLALEVRKDGKLISSPSLILQENSPGSLEIGSTNSSRFSASFKLAADASSEIRVEGEITLTAQGAGAGAEPMRMSLNKKVAPGAPFSESVAQQGSTVLLTGRVFPMPTAGDPAQVPGMQVSAQSALTCPGTQLGRLPALMRMLDENIQVNSVYRGDSAGTVRLVGTATSNARIAQLLGDLAKNPAFENARLVEVLRKDLGLNSYVLEVDPNCRPEVVAAAQAASAAAGANQRRVHIDFSMTDVNVPSLIKTLADVLGKKVEGLDALSAQRISIKAKRVNVEVLMRAALECVGYRLLQNEAVWLAEPDPARSSAADPSACLEESVRNNPGATQPLTVTDMPQPPLFAPGERLIADLKLHMGEGRTSNLYQPVMIGEVMRLNMRDGLALQCVVMVVARSPWLRCADDQEGDPTMVRKAAVMSKIELGSPGTAIARTRAGEMKIEYSLSRKQA